jgi:uncharacterized protein YdeI (YjbR/CyaY-like superfamily)
MPKLTAKPSNAKSAADSYDPRVDVYINKAAAFARPILEYVREVLHESVPDIHEQMKWSRPFFVLNDQIVAQMSAFTKHCGIGFWSPEMAAMLKADGIEGQDASGSFGKVLSLGDLPPRKELVRYVKHAAALVRTGEASSPVASRPRTSARAPIDMPTEFAALLKKSKAASIVFEAFPPSCKREYLEWITTAKRPETKERRMAEAIERIATGRRFNDEYKTK